MKIEVEFEDYLIMSKSELKMDMLEVGGVDNWIGYGDSLFPEDELSYREECDSLEVFLKDKYNIK